MTNEEKKILLLAVASNLSEPNIYQILTETFLDEFDEARKAERALAKKEGRQPKSPLDVMFTCIACKFSVESKNKGLYNDFAMHREVIMNAYYEGDKLGMLTKIAGGPVILNGIKNYLLSQNNFPGMRSHIYSNRISKIHDWFLQFFATQYAGSFQFTGDFVSYTIHAFIRYFFPAHKKDIWALLREKDATKSELEHKRVEVKSLERGETDGSGGKVDEFIGADLKDMFALSKLLFDHTGQSGDSYGVMYDLWLAVITFLCKRKVDKINEEIGERVGDKLVEKIVFVDIYDRRVTREAVASKGVAAKISNGKDLIFAALNLLASGGFNLDTLTECRDLLQNTGKSDNTGNSKLWKDTGGTQSEGAETSRYLDLRESAENYVNYNMLCKGVMGAYSFMHKVMRAGYSVIDLYNPEVMRNAKLMRNINYVSDLLCIDEIKEILDEKVEGVYTDRLYSSFEDQRNAYIGSSDNNHTHIRENRAEVEVRGLLDHPPIKQSKDPDTAYRKLNLICNELNAVPRSLAEYFTTIERKDVFNCNWTSFPQKSAILGRFITVYANSLMIKNPDLARYYLYRVNVRETDSKHRDLIDHSWQISSMLYPSVVLIDKSGNSLVGLYLPLERNFYIYNAGRPSVIDFNGIDNYARSGYAYPTYHTPTDANDGIIRRMSASIGFTHRIGLDSLGFKTTIEQVVYKNGNSLKLDSEYCKYIETYYQWLGECSQFQHGCIELLEVMFVESLSWEHNSSEEVRAIAMSLQDSLISGVFNEGALNSFLHIFDDSHIDSAGRCLQHVTIHDMHFKMRSFDCCVLDYCMGRYTSEQKASFIFSELIPILESKDPDGNLVYDSPAKRFVAIFNHIYIKIEFLMMLRDSYALLLAPTAKESQILVCEVERKFDIIGSIKAWGDTPIDNGIVLDTMSVESVRSRSIQGKKHCMLKFGQLIADLEDYAQICVKTFSDPLPSFVARSSAPTATERFAAYGSTFNTLPPYVGVYELDTLRQHCSSDNAGFLIYNNQRFTCNYRGITYYLHYTGHLLPQDEREPVMNVFNLDVKEEKANYRAMLRDGIAKADARYKRSAG